MKALSVRQPWASLIASGRKTIETRSRRTAYRGPLLICASRHAEIADGLPRGVAVCRVNLVGCRRIEPDDSEAACCDAPAEYYAWLLSDAEVIDHVAVMGRLGIFEVDIQTRPPRD